LINNILSGDAKLPYPRLLKELYPDIDWNEFFDREVRVTCSFEVARIKARAMQIASSSEYATVASKNNWPHHGELKKNPDFVSWDVFLNRKSKHTLDEIRQFCLDHNITCDFQYTKVVTTWNQKLTDTKTPKLPAIKTLKNNYDFPGWDEFVRK
jgi:hypothetical protein